jgi:hypothetical protein
MAKRRSLLRPLVVLAIGALAAGTLAAAPARAGDPTTGVTVLLKAPEPAALARLAAVTGLSHAQRMAKLARLLPGAAAHRQVADALSASGFTVTHETAWTVDASAPAQAVARTFGAVTRPGAATLPSIPASLSRLAAVALPSTGATGVFKPHDDCPLQCHDGGDFRKAYTAPMVPPDTGQDPKATLTIATLQFAPWNDSDLTKYATATGAPLGDPVASGQYKEFRVKGSTAEGATAADQNDEEVDLDQETLLSTDPYANQRAYFDTNSTRGYIQALSQVLADVTQGRGASPDGGDPHIVALSTSWGSCESEFTDPGRFPGDTIPAVEKILQSLTAAGVTIFAASGDDGVYDCGDSNTSTRIAADYPASSPEVVGVGGTRLSSIGGVAANDGTNWSDKGWTCTSTAGCEGGKGTGGSGGGESNTFPAPAYQTSGLGHDPFRTSTGKRGDFGKQPRRLVPDIAVDGDPKTGFDILTSDPTDACAQEPPVVQQLCETGDNPNGLTTSLAVGGTSLSAPASAALLTNMLAAHGVTHGVGDVHGALYSAYAAHNGAFRDPTAGSNGRQQDVDNQAAAHPHSVADLPVNARRGYDAVTGLGAPFWPSIAPYLFTPRSPRPGATLKLASPHSAIHPTRLTARWGWHATGANSLVAGTAHVTIREAGRTKPVYSRTHAAATGSYTFTGDPGGNYSLTVTDRDVSGRRSATVMRSAIVPFDDRTFRLRGSWTRHRSRADFAGSDLVAKHKRALAKATAIGKGYAIVVRTGPTYGKLAILHGTKRLKVVDLYSAGHGRAVVPFFGSAGTPVKRRTFTFRYTGRHSPFSTGTLVDVDALIVIR